MKRLYIYLLMVFIFCLNSAKAQYWEGDKWYTNPLGFEPVKLHTSMGFILPSVAVGICLLVTKKDTTQTHRISVYNETGFSWGYKYPYTFMPQNNTGIVFMLRKWLAIGVEFDIYLPRDKVNTTTGLAIRPFARFYPVSKEKWKMYFESGGGFIYLFDQFPQPTDQDNRLGTNWNGTTKYGIGTEIYYTHSIAILLGIRHLHISNGNTKGIERNPSHDSNGFFIGLSHRF
ncbi:acyloxyacyl hydrolase [Xanthocytophaga agilis]|uniref:Acyloxyacyl hydrolase n=1 Tax=Xanthocytophaga agilis TaxID=3048010 RepID=A0AAE3R1V1_9BACT|nr:acyloxyacyl hydrolase [Xanthocytophaga agilis]MDJ1500067.1 acyloxyacyl hydrolase [Xanthocytophaga agilis]